MDKRVKWVDTLKALGILAVYLGHFADNAGRMYSFVFAYHVPLFFFVSGFFAHNKKDETILQSVKNKFLQLMIPYFGFVIITAIIYSLCMDVSMSDMLIQGLLGIRNQLFAKSLWFLPCLFVMSVIYSLILRVVKKKNFALIVAIIVFVITQTLFAKSPSGYPSWFWNIDSALYYLIFYAIGAVLYSYLKNFSYRSLSLYKKIAVSGFLLLCILVTGVVYLKGSGVIYSFVGTDFFLILWALKIAVPILLIFANILLSCVLQNLPILNSIGRSTLVLCGTEQAIKVLIPTVLTMFSIPVKMHSPLATLLYAIICVTVNQYTLVRIINKYIPVLRGEWKEIRILNRNASEPPKIDRYTGVKASLKNR